MVVLNRIYTKTGDAGTTALGTGERVPKTRCGSPPTAPSMKPMPKSAWPACTWPDASRTSMRCCCAFRTISSILGADLCVPDRGEKLPYEPLRVSDAQVKRLEDEIDLMNASLEPLRSFVLPGGTPAGAALHVVRTVSRRAERLIVELSLLPDETVSAPVLKYINRLSDFLFVASRYVNDRGKADVLWVPGKNR